MSDIATASPATPASATPDRRRHVSKRAAAIAAGSVASIVYLLTMNRTLGFLDSGEVAAAASTLGIMHPTGYPTLTMLAHLVTLVAPVRDILALNILAALLAGAGVGALALLFDRLAAVAMTPRARPAEPTARTSSKRSRTAKGQQADARRDQRDAGSRPAAPLTVESVEDGARHVVAALVALFVGFTAIWWEQATGFEVYALQALLLPLVTLLFVRFVERERARRDTGAAVRMSADATAFTLVLGLAFTNHMMTVFLAPAFLLFYAWSLGVNARSLRRLALLVPPFLAGLLPYLYLPLRASMDPRFNWGRPDSWQRFVDHISGKFAWEWMFSSREVYDAQTAYFFDRLPAEVAWIGLALALVGLVVLTVRSPRHGVWSALIFAGCVAYAGGYRIYDIELYYPTAVLAVGIWTVAALGWLLTVHRPAALATAALLAVANLALHYAGNDRSGNRLAEDFVHNVLVTAPRNATIFSSNAAVFVTGSYYLQEVERLRPDVTVINHDYLSNRWYVEELRAWRPEMMRTVWDDVERYYDLLAKAEAGDVRAGLASTEALGNIAEGLIAWTRSKGGHAIVVGGLDPGFGGGLEPVPYQLGYRLVSDTTYVPQPFPSYRFEHWRFVDPFAANVYELYGRHLAYRASYEARHGHDSLARRYIEYARTFDPQYDLENARELPLDAMSQVRATAEFYARLGR